jgi:hypothetical protein
MSRVLNMPVRQTLSDVHQPLIAAVGMAISLMLLQRFVIDGNSEDTMLRLGLLVLQIGIGAGAYFTLLMLLAPRTVREMATGLRSLAAHLSGPNPSDRP